MKILAVDDLAENRYFLEFTLRSLGHEVVSAQDGEEALAAVQRERFDVVVSDVLMPRMDGFQLCRTMKRQPATRGIPFVFYTATYTDEKDAELGLSLGAARYLIRPQQPQDFARILREVVNETGEQPITPFEVAAEDEFLAAYTQRLVRKLDTKVAELSGLAYRLQEELEAKEREIAQRRTAEEALRNSQAALATAQRIAKLGSWELRPASAANLVRAAVSCSAELLRLMGRDPGDASLTTSDLLEAVPSSDRVRVKAAIRAALAGHPTERLEHALIRRDGSLRDVEVTIQVDDSPGSNGGPVVTGTVQDVTERKHLESVARQAQKMEHLGLLAAGIAHDFNNVLSTILMNAESLLSASVLPDREREVVQEMVRAGERGAQLTSRLLTFAQRRPLLRQRLDLRELVEETATLLRRTVGDDVDLQIQLPAEPLPVLGDGNLLGQMLVHLVVNARDAMPQGGRIRIEAERVMVEEGKGDRQPQTRGPAICLSVVDTGAGIAQADLPRIFDPFFTTRPGNRSGLGLAAVHGIVGQHQGWLSVESVVGQGTRIDVHLPVTSDRPLEGVVDRASPPAGERILLVEDDAPVRNAAARHLRQLGYQVLEAGDGAAALALFSEVRSGIDLLVADLLLPGGMSGREIARRMREMEPSLRVLYVTGYGGDAVDGLEGGEAVLLAKPITPARLERAVRGALGQGR
jgi:signal transduction histidine kinase